MPSTTKGEHMKYPFLAYAGILGHTYVVSKVRDGVEGIHMESCDLLSCKKLLAEQSETERGHIYKCGRRAGQWTRIRK